MKTPERNIVLLIDDEPESLSLLQRTLRGTYQTLEARSGREGLCCLEKHPVAVVIADQRMPEMTGVEFFTESFHRCPHTQRILLTGYTEVDGLVNAINAGQVFGYLAKPWHPNDLLTILRRAWDAWRLFQENEQLLKDLQQKNKELHALLQETRTLQAAKLQSERWAAIGKLAGMVAHDMRNPLTAIQCHAGLLEDRALSMERRQRSLKGIMNQAVNMKEYIDDLLNVSRPGLSEPLSLKACAVSDLVSRFKEAFNEQCLKKNIFLRQVNTCQAQVMVDTRQIFRVFNNLLQNAIEAVQGGGEILIDAEELNEQEVVIRIADSGQGIPEEVAERLCEPFVTRNKSGGTGLGLAIVKKIVDEHGGRLWQKPCHLKGACFHVALPRRNPEDRTMNLEG